MAASTVRPGGDADPAFSRILDADRSGFLSIHPSWRIQGWVRRRLQVREIPLSSLGQGACTTLKNLGAVKAADLDGSHIAPRFVGAVPQAPGALGGVRVHARLRGGGAKTTAELRTAQRRVNRWLARSCFSSPSSAHWLPDGVSHSGRHGEAVRGGNADVQEGEMT